MMKKNFSLFICLFCFIFNWIDCTPISTFYGIIEVEEPILLELIESPSFQRLKGVHQYGVSYYCTQFDEEYSRYEHSLGVFAVLRLKGASLKEQIAGLLHDVSHTVFSHVGDWVFAKMHQEKDYQNSIHPLFLDRYGLGKILNKYGYTIDEILPEEALFPMLEKPGTELCADRIDYNIQGAFYRGFITYEEAQTSLKSLEYVSDKWVSNEPSLMKKLARFSFYMSEFAWGSPENHMLSLWLSSALLRALDIELLSFDDLHFGTDDLIWDRLKNSEDSYIKAQFEKLASAKEYYQLVEIGEDADLIIKTKFRGIDPWVISPLGPQRLTTLHHEIYEEFHATKERFHRGWKIKFFDPS